MAENQQVSEPVRFGVVTVSDRASAGVYEDRGGPAIREFLDAHVSTPHDYEARLVADERPDIEAVLIELVDEHRCCLVVTTGGTGPAVRDITPEATEAVCERMLPGFGELMRSVSLQVVPTAILSRQTAGVRGGAVIINLPGKPSAIDDCLTAVMPAVPYCIDLIDGPRIELGGGLQAFRPKGA